MASLDPSMMPMPPRRQGPLVMLVLMGGLFLVLAGLLVRNYAGWAQGGGGASRPAAAPATSSKKAVDLATLEQGLPREAGFAQRNVDYGGNLAPIAAREGAPMGMDEAVYRVALDLSRADAAKFYDRTSQIPKLKDLLAEPRAFHGMSFTFRIVPAEVWDYANNVPERVTSWRVYGIMQRSPEEFVVLETLEPPPVKDWTLKRDVIEVDALFLRNATYETRKDKTVTVPYFLAKSFRRIHEDTTAAAPAPGVGQLLLSKYGPVVGLGMLVFVLLTAWTLRRHARQAEKREREHFYTMLRTRGPKGPGPKKPTNA